MFVPFVVGRTAQLFRTLPEKEACLVCVVAEYSDFFEVIGRTALNTRNCVAAASEFRNVCLERDSFSSVA